MSPAEKQTNDIENKILKDFLMNDTEKKLNIYPKNKQTNKLKMGFTIIPLCKKCGYQTKAISVGGGKLNHRIQCGAPALNIESNEIEQINLYDYKSSEIVKQRFLYFFYRNVNVEKTDNRYIPYYEPKMFVDDKKIGSHHWSDKYYKKSKNFCPKCKSFNLDFLNGGVWFD